MVFGHLDVAIVRSVLIGAIPMPVG